MYVFCNRLLLAERMCEESISWLNEAFISETYDSADGINTFDDLRRRQEVCT